MSHLKTWNWSCHISDSLVTTHRQNVGWDKTYDLPDHHDLYASVSSHRNLEEFLDPKDIYKRFMDKL
jgi:hypothetical protein